MKRTIAIVILALTLMGCGPGVTPEQDKATAEASFVQAVKGNTEILGPVMVPQDLLTVGYALCHGLEIGMPEEEIVAKFTPEIPSSDVYYAIGSARVSICTVD